MYLGIDLGTSSVKILLIDDCQRIIASTQSGYEVMRPKSGWSEQNPSDWINSVKSAMDELKLQYPAQLSAVRGIGLSGQMHGATLLGRDDKVLRPCMLWNDTRSHHEAAQFDAIPEFRTISGNIVFPGFTAPKVRWIQHHEPSLFNQTAKILLPKDYVRLWLTSEHATDMSDASGTSWLDVAKRDWSEPLLEKCDLSLSHMPKLVEGAEVSGYLRSELAAAWGMNRVVPVAGGAGDNAASAIGMGAVKTGDAFLSLGTSGVIFIARDKILPKPESAVHSFCHGLPGLWHQMGVILSATDSLNWYATIAGRTPAELTRALGSDIKEPCGVIFLPYLSGERTPHNDANIRGSFVGISHTSDLDVITHAVLEGVCYALRDNLVAIEEAGSRIEAISAVGGGSRSRYWLALASTILQRPVIVPKIGDYGAAFGAARLAILAAGDGNIGTICTAPETLEIIEPDLKLAGRYREAYDRFGSIYRQIKGV